MLAIVVLLLLAGGSRAQEDQPVAVYRYRDGDTIESTLPEGSCKNMSCSSPNVTYLVGDRECMNDTVIRKQYCTRGHYLAASNTFMDISAHIGIEGILMVFDNRTGTYEEGKLYNRMNHLEVETGGCTVTDLAVIRRLGDNIAINHGGFTIVNANFMIRIQVDEANLVYDREDYNGEVYHLSFTCMRNTSPNCVVFKLNGTSDLRQGKFEKRLTAIPSQVTDFCSPAIPTTSIPSTTSSTTQGSGSRWLLNDPVIHYIIIGSSCGIGVLICTISFLCCGIFLLSIKSRSTSAIHARRMELRYAGGGQIDEDHYYLQNNPNYVGARQRAGVAEASVTVDMETQPEPDQTQAEEEDHMYAIVEDVQAEVEEVRRKENTAAKFKYASITFDTFKPVDSLPTRPPVHQSDVEFESRRDRLPSFARNYNPAANRVELARSYEVVTLKPKSEAGVNEVGGEHLSQGYGTDDEYDKLMHEKKELMVTSQRNFSISYGNVTDTADYSQLNQVQNRFTQVRIQPQLKLPGCSSPNNAEVKVKPMPKKRTNLPKPNPLSSYTAVKKHEGPPLPPPYDPMFDKIEGTEKIEEEEHYKVPMKQKRITSGHYDHPSSLIRVAWSCENLGSTQASAEVQDGAIGLYDIPSSLSPSLAAHKRNSMVLDQPLQELSLHSLFSQDSYIDMTATHV